VEVRKEKDPELVKRGKSARLKGAGGEREVCDILTRIVGEKHSRILGQARDAGADVRYGPFLLEVKRQARLKMSEWQQQVKVAADAAGVLPGIVWRRDGEKWWVAVEFEQFVTIFEALRQGGSHGPHRTQPDGAESGNRAGP
jgi:hypothetical protein